MSAAENLRTARRSKTYATVAADKDLVADGPGGVPAIRLRIGGAGTLVYVSADGTTDTITDLLAGDVLEVSARQLTATGTTATKVTVFW